MSDLKCLRPQSIPSVTEWLTTGAKHLARNSGMYYHEVVLGEDSPDKTPQVGWLTTEFEEKDIDRIGVGDDDNGWAIDGVRHKQWHNGPCADVWFPRQWQEGDVIGLAIDIEAGTMQFSFNGIYMPSTSFNFKASGCSFFPALSMRGLFDMRIPRATWQFAPPSEEYQPWAKRGIFSRPIQAAAKEEDELEQRRQLFMDVFSTFDADGSGTLSLAEFSDLMKEISKGYFDDAKIIDILVQCDANADGTVDIDEFARWTFSPQGRSSVAYAKEKKADKEVEDIELYNEEWRPRVRNLKKRVPTVSVDLIQEALIQTGGHAGEAYKILSNYEESRLAGPYGRRPARKPSQRSKPTLNALLGMPA